MAKSEAFGPVKAVPEIVICPEPVLTRAVTKSYWVNLPTATVPNVREDGETLGGAR